MRKTPIRDVDLDELERQLRAFEPLCTKTSTLGAGKYPPTEYARTVGGKNSRNAKSGRENPRDPPAPASSVHPRQRSTKGSAEKINIDKTKIDDVERQLREVASSALRKATPPPKKGDYLSHGINSRAGLCACASMLMLKQPQRARPRTSVSCKASWRPVILQTYGERSVAWRCARSLALPLLLLSLGAGTLVVLSPEGALTNIDQLLEDAHARQVARDDQKPSEGMVVTGASFDQPRRSTMLAEPSAQAMASSVAAPGGEAGPTQLPASSGGPSSGAVSPPIRLRSRFTIHLRWCPFVLRTTTTRQSPLTPIRLALAHEAIARREARRQLLLRQLRPRLSRRSGSPNAVIAPRSDALPGGVASEAPPPAMAGLATPQASISLPTDTPSPTPDAAASSSLAIESHGFESGLKW